jgi:hypothetical protein
MEVEMKRTKYTPSQVFAIGVAIGFILGAGVVAVVFMIVNS